MVPKQHNSRARSQGETSLGTRLRQHRKQRGMTMQTVASQAGLSIGFISQIERDLTAPSLASLAAIARALGAPISAFLAQPPASPEISRVGQRSSFLSGGASMERLSSRFPGSILRAVAIQEPPGREVPTSSHEGEEMLYILDGEMTLVLDGETTLLTTGDSVHFDSRRPHSTHNHSDRVCHVLWYGTADIFGEDADHPTAGKG